MNTSLNTYLEHQSRKSHSLFEGSSRLEDLMQQCGARRDMQQMEQWLKRSRDNIERAIASTPVASANAAQLADDDLPATVLRFQ